MSIYGSDEQFGGGFAAVEALRDTLRASPTIVSPYWIESVDDVYAHTIPEDLSERVVVVREVSLVGGRVSNQGMYDDVPIQVMAMIRRTLSNGAENPNAHRWLSNFHRRVHRVIVGTSPSLLVGTPALPLRLEEYPSTPAIDERIRYWYSTAQYNLTLAPL